MKIGFKQKVVEQFRQLLYTKVILLQESLDELKESGKNETKSTAGDKHETALAMLQIEQENKRAQLKNAQVLVQLFNKITIIQELPYIIKGSLVKTDRGYFFLSVPAGKLTIDGITVIAISPESPLGSKLLGSIKGVQLQLNSIQYRVEEIL